MRLFPTDGGDTRGDFVAGVNDRGVSLGVEPVRRALVVEDEILIRMDIAEELRRIGWDVVEVCSADDAIDVLTRDHNFQLLLTDVHMPGTHDGLDLARLAKSQFRAIKVAVMSGHHAPNASEQEFFDVFLSKPVASLRQQLSPLLDSEHADNDDA